MEFWKVVGFQLSPQPCSLAVSPLYTRPFCTWQIWSVVRNLGESGVYVKHFASQIIFYDVLNYYNKRVKIIGYEQSYIGRTPHVYIADPDLIRMVFVKDFDHFGNRQKVDLGSAIMNELLIFSQGQGSQKLLHSLRLNLELMLVTTITL